VQQHQYSMQSSFQSNVTQQQYAAAFNKVMQYIYDGDCYEVCLTQRFIAEVAGSSWAIYQALREKSPTPYAGFMSSPQGAVLSCSPERFLQVSNRNVETKPIKGTRPRGNTLEEDQQLAQALLASEKDRAENLMIVDLMRNDISKNCAVGSVKVPKLFGLETFPTVHHLVSTVTGKLAENKTAIDLLRDCFPGGSITGAPKIRAMEIIEELEPYRRSVYCGSLSYISFCGNMDSNIAIRTLIHTQEKLYCSAGGALVADSICEEEYQECFDKVGKLLSCLAQA